MEPDNVLLKQIDMVPEFIAEGWKRAKMQVDTLGLSKSGISQILIGGCGDSLTMLLWVFNLPLDSTVVFA